ncbi:iron chelate uptake ABC transporter family permease subunit [Sinorhizobium sp. BG8]|uniref:FecCD family ABC transporter permease n=1 Tax=Sinorhizobium sp. BG8 TaxID=2613773 RepID=UPI00193DCE28|nr:iron chelate uptake ABC transporter family permease subunit [Sinorhizobium sp. BG8]QRM56471.1 iron chelate uptake ABC transporter family permease subunit [Sinorhizobium sp. BG8]
MKQGTSLKGAARRLAGRHAQGDRSAIAKATVLLLAILGVVVFLYSMTTGASGASAWDVMTSLLSGGSLSDLDARDRIIVLDIRLPRAVLGVLIGAALAISGTVMQGLFRNPLADPGLIGVSSGAALGAVAMIIFESTLPAGVVAVIGAFALPLAAFVGALVSTLLLYRIATLNGQTSVATMLLAGIAIAALAIAITGILIYMADDKQLRDITFWNLGSLSGITWSKVLTAGPIIAVSLIVIPMLARGLNAITLGEATAYHMGVSVQRLKNVAIVAVAAAVGASVAVSGGIGFVGIIVPHMLRLVIGPDHRYLLPASALLGGILLLVADMIARAIVAPAELPIGIITALVGAPFFLWILLRGRAAHGL